MSTKQRLAEAIAELPDSLSLEEAVERLYRAFKAKQSWEASKSTPRRRCAGSARGLIRIAPDFDEPLADFEERMGTVVTKRANVAAPV